MSIELMAKVWRMPTDTPAEKLVLLAMADRADDEGLNVRPSVTKTAERCCLDRRTVQRAMTKFQDLGVLVLVCQRVGYPNVYRLDIERLEQIGCGTVSPAAESRTCAKKGRRQVAPPADTDRTPCGVVPHNTSEQPSKQPPEDNSGARAEVLADPPPPSLIDMPAAEAVPPFAKDWPVLHCKDGDWEVPAPYCDVPELKEALIAWMLERSRDKKKGMPTVFGMRRTNCGWWDKYPMDAVLYAVVMAAGRQWQGIIEDIARDWKPPQGTVSSEKSSVRQGVQHMANHMEARQQMIRNLNGKVNGTHVAAVGGGNHDSGTS